MPGTGEQLGPYLLGEELGRGSFGRVFRAARVDGLRPVPVAVKIPHSLDPADAAFLREADAWLKIEGHANVVPLLDVRIEQGYGILVSELVTGGSLRSRIGIPPGPAKDPVWATQMIVGVLRGLVVLHAAGIVHRDLKPENVLLQHDHPRLTDFGISRFASRSLETVGEFAGTPLYSPPEAFAGRIGPSTDLWAAGVMLHELLTGTLPFTGENDIALRLAITNGSFPPLPSTLPPELRRVVSRALDPRFDNRFPSAATFLAALEPIHHALAAGPVRSETTEKLVPDPGTAGAGQETEGKTPPEPGRHGAPPDTSTHRQGSIQTRVQSVGPTTTTASPNLGTGTRSGARVGRRVGIAMGCAAVLGSGWLFGPGLLGRQQSPPDRRRPPGETASAGSEDRKPEAATVNRRDLAALVSVPAGEFEMGTDKGGESHKLDEEPRRRVKLTRGFLLYQHEVTNANYRKFLAERTEARKPELLDDPRFGKDELPVVGVTWEEARQYAQWAGGQLPTEAEWEYAARGTKSSRYPWGDESPTPTRALFSTPTHGPEAPHPVGSFPAGKSWCGALDLIGNVTEWCHDWFGQDYYSHGDSVDPRGPASGVYRVLRGGSYLDFDVQLSASRRDSDGPRQRKSDVGFRVVIDPPGSDRRQP